ncbi:N/A [soil metagenome]
MPRCSGSQLMRMVLSYLALLLFTLCAIYPISSLVAASPRPAPRSEALFLPWLGQSSLVALAVAITGVAISSAVGYTLSRSRFLRRRSTLTGALFTQLGPAVLFLLPILALLFWLGLIDSYLALSLIFFVTTLPFCAWQMKSYYDTIPLALEEAAEIEGASPGRIFSRIVLPLAVPALAMTALFSWLIAWNEYVIAAIAVRNADFFSGPPRVSMMGPSLEWYPAAGLLVSIPALLLFLLLSRVLVARSLGAASR